MKHLVAVLYSLAMCVAWGLFVGFFISNVAPVPIWINIPVSFILGFAIFRPLAWLLAGIEH